METRNNKRRHSSDDSASAIKEEIEKQQIKKQRRQSLAPDQLRIASGYQITHESSDINLSEILGSSSNLPNEFSTTQDAIPIVELPLTNEGNEEKHLVSSSDALIVQNLKSDSERRNSDGSIGERVKEQRRNSKENPLSPSTKEQEAPQHTDPIAALLNSEKYRDEIEGKGFKQLFLPTAPSAIHTPKFNLNDKDDKLFLDILKSYIADLKELFGQDFKKIIVGTTKTRGLAQLLFRKENSQIGDYDLYYVNRSLLSGDPEAWKPKLLKNPDRRGHAFLFMLKFIPGVPTIYPKGYEDLPHFEFRFAVLGTSGHARLALDESFYGVFGVGEHISGRPEKINPFSGTFRQGNDFETEGMQIFTIKNGKYAPYKDFIFGFLARKFINNGVYEAPKNQKPMEEEREDKKNESSRFFLFGNNASFESLPSAIGNKDVTMSSEKKRPASPTEGEDTKKRKMSK